MAGGKRSNQELVSMAGIRIAIRAALRADEGRVNGIAPGGWWTI